MKTSATRRSASGFTLIELLAVITIIIILAGLIIGGLGFVNEKQAREKAKVQINLLANALEEYKLDHGDYPPFPNSSAGTGRTNALYRALYLDGVTNPDQSKIYLPDLDPGPANKPSNKQGWIQGTGTGVTITDPWGNEYRYRSAKGPTGSRNSSTQNPDFDIWSVGKDGRTNTDPNHRSSQDDVRNY